MTLMFSFAHLFCAITMKACAVFMIAKMRLKAQGMNNKNK